MKYILFNKNPQKKKKILSETQNNPQAKPKHLDGSLALKPFLILWGDLSCRNETQALLKAFMDPFCHLSPRIKCDGNIPEI